METASTSTNSPIQTSSSGSSLPGTKVAPEIIHSSQYEADASYYKLQRLIGEGSICSSSVYYARHCQSDKPVVVKCIELDIHEDENNGRNLALAISEMHMTSICHHANIIHHHTAFIHHSQIWLVMDYMDKGSVRDVLDNQFYDGLPELAIASIISQLVQALQYLHAKDIVHRSVKASHLLISSNVHIQLTGLKYSVLMQRDGLPVSFINDFNGDWMGNNIYWLCPQILAQHVSGYSNKSDMYSVGIVACEMANGLVPFCEMEPTKMFKEKLDGTVPKLIDKTTCPPILPNGGGELQALESDMGKRHIMLQERVFSKSFHDFVAQCLSLSEHQRPSPAEALSLSFLKNNVKQSREAFITTLQAVQLAQRNTYIAPSDHDNAMDLHKLTLTSSDGNMHNVSNSSHCDEWNF